MESVIFQVAIPAALGLMMIGLGLDLELKNFSALLKKPKAVLIGVGLQMVGLPLLGFLTSILFQASPEKSLGIMILVCCAGGVVTSIFTQIAKGDIALSVVLTCICMLFGTVTIPILINMSIEHFMDASKVVKLNLLPTSLRLLSITIIPVTLGMLFRVKFKSIADNIQPAVAKLSNILLVGLVVVFVIKDIQLILKGLQELFPMLLTLNLAGMFLGIFLAKIFGLSPKHGKTFAIECGIQNSATGIFIATTLLGNANLALPTIIYAAISYMTIAVFIGFWLSSNKFASHKEL